MSATFDSPDHGWVLGDAPCGTPPCTSVLRTRDGGHSWHGIPAPRTAIASSDTARHEGVGQPNAGQVSSIRFGDESNGWAFGTALWSTHDGGASWKQQSIAQAVDRTVALESSSGSTYAVVATGCAPDPSPGCNSVVLYQTPVGSDDWQQVGPPQRVDARGSREGEYAQLVLRGGSYFVLAGSVVFGRTSDQAFGPLSQPCTDPGFPYAQPSALAAADSNHLDVMCDEGDAHMGRGTQQLRGSTDGGHTFSASGPHFTAPHIALIADNTKGGLLAAEASIISRVARTTDDGSNFASVLEDRQAQGNPWADLGYTTPDQGFVVNYGRVMYLSHDAGATWQPVGF